MKKYLTPILLALLCPACVSQFEHMSKGTERGDSYTYHYGQIGGQGTGQSSMGTSVAFDGQKSLADVVQGWVARGFSLDQVKVRSIDALTERHLQSQITARTLAELKTKLALAQSTDELTAILANIK